MSAVPSAGASRPSKRKRGASGFSRSSGENAASSGMPPEVWAMVMNYLDYESVLSCAATSKLMLNDAMPLVTMLNIDKACQLNARLAPRYRDVRGINVYSLLTENSEFDIGDDNLVINYFEVDYDSVMQVVPFISRFTALERVFLGGKKSSGEEIAGFCHKNKLWNEEEDVERAHVLIDAISGAFRCGTLPPNLRIFGLRCPRSKRTEEEDFEVSECQCCTRACKSFPLDQVINFDNRGSSENDGSDFSTERSCCLDVCLARSQIESIVEIRPGGRALLHSNARFFHLLGKGYRYEIPSDDGAPLYVVMFYREQLNELKRVIEYTHLDVKNLSQDDVTTAIMLSFAKDDRGLTRPTWWYPTLSFGGNGTSNQ